MPTDEQGKWSLTVMVDTDFSNFETKISTYASTLRILLCYFKNHILYFVKWEKRELSNWITTSCWQLMKV